MKKTILILILALLVLPLCFARTYTEEEFLEVYNALIESTELLEEANNTINSLKDSNEKLIAQLESAKTKFIEINKLLEEAKKELADSSKTIESLLNQKIFLGAGVAVTSDFSSIAIGAKINFGYKLWLGHIIGDVSVFSNKTFAFGLSYSIIL